MRNLLIDIFGHDFSGCKDGADVRTRFFDTTLTLPQLAKLSAFISQSHVVLGGVTIPAALSISGANRTQPPFVILAQLHGNEPAGLAGIAMAMALSQAGLLTQEVIGIIGNPLAARQYFAAYAENPLARQETRDCYRCGVDAQGRLLSDMNRIPADFMTQDSSIPSVRRAQELYALGQHISGIADIHTARGTMMCITDHKRDADLRHSPLRSVLTGLAGAIAANASAGKGVQTLKAVLHPLVNIRCHVGIEAGRHEAPEAPHIAASFTLSLLHTLGITPVLPLYDREDGRFMRYAVKPKLTYADLSGSKNVESGDTVFMAKKCMAVEAIPSCCDRVIIRKKDGSYAVQTILQHIIRPEGKLCFAVYQRDEMEVVAKSEVVAVAVPSGEALKAPFGFSGIFFSKSAALYDKDPAVGPWPVAASQLAHTKFCYPCDVSEMIIGFS